MSGGLTIGDVAQRTGIAAGTIRMWEQRYDFPRPRRTSSGYRRYSEQEAEALARVAALRRRGLSVGAAIERAQGDGCVTDRGSIYGALATGPDAIVPQELSKGTLLAISRAIEDETLARAAAPVLVGAFQHERNYRAVEHRYRRIAQSADASLVFADFGALRSPDGGPVEVPIEPDEAIGHEWAVIVDAPGYAACLLAWEQPQYAADAGAVEPARRFEAVWTIDPRVVRRASMVAAGLARAVDGALGARLEALLEDRPLAVESPAPALTALTNRMLGYLEAPNPATA